VAFFYYLRFGVATFAAPSDTGEAPKASVSRRELVLLAAALALLLLPGLYPEPLIALAGASVP
jgi:NADH:ubiquinone oxidoreductase subunit 2 (subunit N)